ncbi:MAG: hypothetical protein WC503_06905, partial [Candidatus Shapirobacteria bacterium]
MSQKRLKKIRRVETVSVVKEENVFLPKFWEIIKKNWIFLIIISALSIALFANAMGGDFVSDDYATITQNPQIGNFWYTMNWNTFGNSMNLSNFFVYKLFGYANPMPYHVMSLMWFLAFNILGFVFVRLISKSDLVAKLTMLLFIFHPIHVEAVSWIAGRVYVILGVYIVASLINFIYFLDSGKLKSLILSGVFFLLAFSTDRPRPFAIFLLIGLYILSFSRKIVVEKYAKYFGIMALISLVALIISWPYITTRIAVVNGGINASDGIFYNPLFQYPTAIPKYLQLLFFPIDLTLYHTMYVLPGWLNFVILINYLALTVYFYFKDKRYFFALAFIFISIAPSMAPVKVSWLVAERYIFLGSLGFSLFFGFLLADHWKKLRLVT